MPKAGSSFFLSRLALGATLAAVIIIGNGGETGRWGQTGRRRTTTAATAAPAGVYGPLILFGVSAIGWNGVFIAKAARIAPQGRIGDAIDGVMVSTCATVLVGPPTLAGAFALVGEHTASFGFCAAVSLAGMTLALAARCAKARG